jgi:hypothetical protein
MGQLGALSDRFIMDRIARPQDDKKLYRRKLLCEKARPRPAARLGFGANVVTGTDEPAQESPRDFQVLVTMTQENIRPGWYHQVQ